MRALPLLLWAAACSSSTTEVVVVVSGGDVRVPDDVAALHITAGARVSPVEIDTIYDSMRLPLCAGAAAAGCYALPVTLGLVPGPSHPSDAVRVTVEALAGAAPVITDSATFTFTTGTRSRLDFTLSRACLQTNCAQNDQTCGANAQCATVTPTPLPGGVLALDGGHP